ncbi:hypothetical protein Dimus_036899, partial [Dionaea muscipula]
VFVAMKSDHKKNKKLDFESSPSAGTLPVVDASRSAVTLVSLEGGPSHPTLAVYAEAEVEDGGGILETQICSSTCGRRCSDEAAPCERRPLGADGSVLVTAAVSSSRKDRRRRESPTSSRLGRLFICDGSRVTAVSRWRRVELRLVSAEGGGDWRKESEQI